MAKECPNCKAVGKKRTLRYKTDWNTNSFAIANICEREILFANKTAKTGYYVCRKCGFKTRA